MTVNDDMPIYDEQPFIVVRQTDKKVFESLEIVEILENQLKYDTISIDKKYNKYVIYSCNAYGEADSKLGEGKTLLEALQSIGKEVEPWQINV